MSKQPEQAPHKNAPIQTDTINALYTYLRGQRDETAPQPTLSQQLNVIHAFTTLRIILKDGNFDLNYFDYLSHVTNLTVVFQSKAIQYNRLFLNRVFALKHLEKLSIVYYPMPYIPETIQALSNLQQLSISTALELQNKADLKKWLPDCVLSL